MTLHHQVALRWIVVVLLTATIIGLTGGHAVDDQLLVDRGSAPAVRHWPVKTAVEEYRIYSGANVMVYHQGQLIDTTETDDGGHLEDITIIVDAFQQSFTLILYKNRRLFSSSCVVKEVSKTGQSIKNINYTSINCYYTGNVTGDPLATTAVDTCHGVLGYFTHGDQTYSIEPVNGSGSLRGEHRVYRDSDSLLPAYTCGHDSKKSNIINTLEHVDFVLNRKKRSFNWPQDLDRQTKTVEFYAVNEYSQYNASGSNFSRTVSRTMSIVNIASSLYHPLDIYIVLVGIEVWTGGSLIRISDDAESVLNQFSDYRTLHINPYHPNDNAHLIAARGYPNLSDNKTRIVGLATTPAMCSYSLSAAIISDIAVLPGLAGVTLAHEMGHNFGMQHDTDFSSPCQCDDPTGHCIMYPQAGTPLSSKWSQCSKQSLAYYIDQGIDICLYNAPQTVYDPTAVCGNGIVENGEECDCGSAPSNRCNSTCCSSCRLVGSARCAAGRCCNIATCQLRPIATVCRPASGSCDLAEYCSGVDATCPSDAYKQDGKDCTDITGSAAYCYGGACQSHASQCQMWFGPSVSNSDTRCYTMINVVGDERGNCGHNVSSGAYTACSVSDALCGSLHCNVVVTNLNQLRRYDFWQTSVYRVRLMYPNGTTAFNCTVASCEMFYDGSGVRDVGMVQDGTRCGSGQMCLSSKCVSVSSLSVPQCPNCNQHGVCNNLGQCHCDAGYAPPDCSQPGGGGSIHSNPITAPTVSSTTTTAATSSTTTRTTTPSTSTSTTTTSSTTPSTTRTTTTPTTTKTTTTSTTTPSTSTPTTTRTTTTPSTSTSTTTTSSTTPKTTPTTTTSTTTTSTTTPSTTTRSTTPSTSTSTTTTSPKATPTTTTSTATTTTTSTTTTTTTPSTSTSTTKTSTTTTTPTTTRTTTTARTTSATTTSIGSTTTTAAPSIRSSSTTTTTSTASSTTTPSTSTSSATSTPTTSKMYSSSTRSSQSYCSTTNIDMVFVVDSSTKSDSSAWQKMLTFVNSVIDKFNVGRNAVHVAFVRYSDQPTVVFGLNSYLDRASIQSNIASVQYVGGGSNVASALDAVRTQVFTSSEVRSNALKVAIIVADQLPAISVNGLEIAINNARSANIRMYGVGIAYVSGRNLDSNSLYQLSFNADQSQPWQATWAYGYNDLSTRSNTVAQFACVR